MPYDLEKLIITNAAGDVKTREQAMALLDTPLTRIVWGSEKIDPWEGNVGRTYYYDPETKTAVNSKGLPCRGFKYARSVFEELRPLAHRKGKRLVLNTAESRPTNAALLAQELAPFVDIIEFNAGCPNVWVDGQQKPIPSYDPDLLQRNLDAIDKKVRGKCRIELKLSPIQDELFEALASVINNSCVEGITAVNTLPNQSMKKPDGSEALAFAEKEGAQIKNLGGMSGAPLRAEALRVQRGLRPLLKPYISWIYCGGIFEAADAITPLEEGADGFAIGTAFFERGPKVFGEVLDGL